MTTAPASPVPAPAPGLPQRLLGALGSGLTTTATCFGAPATLLRLHAGARDARRDRR